MTSIFNIRRMRFALGSQLELQDRSDGSRLSRNPRREQPHRTGQRQVVEGAQGSVIPPISYIPGRESTTSKVTGSRQVKGVLKTRINEYV